MTPAPLFRSLAILAAFSLGATALPGCAGEMEEGDEDAEMAEAAASDVALYTNVAKSGRPVVQEVTKPTATVSASTRLIGHIPRVAPSAALDRLLTIGKWTEIVDADGDRPFSQARVAKQTGSGFSRRIDASLTANGGVKLDVNVVSKPAAQGATVNITNTSEFRHWLIGPVLAPGKLVIDVKLIPHSGGTIVDATMKVKLLQREEDAADLTGAIKPTFEWLKRTAR